METMRDFFLSCTNCTTSV